MSSIRCTNGHVNPPDSRFCRFCGEQMVAEGGSPSTEHPHPEHPLVGLRYRIIRRLGDGGFGCTYLAEDEQRFREPCVLKEFAPKVEGAEALRKAESLFEREAGVLYRLRHSQIPRFRELLRAEFEGRDRLFLVQDYIDGPTYQEVLNRRMEQGRGFTEPEILQFLSQLLPVLDYIHRMGVIHRDISPDNLILRTEDDCPVLIDFGGVKQAAVTIESELGRSPQPAQPHSIQKVAESNVTLVGKQGFAPREQMQDGRVKPHSDLYALAVTVLVLMTGQAPRDLLNSESASYWENQFSAHGGMGVLLRAVLKRMLSDRPDDRYPSAQQVMDALGFLRIYPPSPASKSPSAHGSSNHNSNRQAPQPTPPPAAASAAPPQPNASIPAATTHTVAVSPAPPNPPTHSPTSPTKHSSNGWHPLLTVFIILTLAGIGGWVGYRWVPQWLNLDGGNEGAEPPQESGGDLDAPSSQFSPEEQSRKDALRSRRDALGVDNSFLVTLTDAQFYNDYPRQQGRRLTDSPDDAVWRERWDAIAADWLNTLEATLSPDARRNLGSYDQGDRDQWKQAVNRLYVSSNALNDLADAEFFHLFPDQRTENFINQPIGQIWHGIAFDQVQALQSKRNLKDIRFADGATRHEVSGELAPGEGQVFTLNLTENQKMEVDVDARQGDVRMSIYVPRPTEEIPFLQNDGRSLDWSGTLPQSGYYEIVLVSTTNQPMRYQLAVEVTDD